MHIQLLNIHRL